MEERRKTRIFFDMDGTLARFYEDPDWLRKFKEPGYFLNLRPYEEMLEALKLLRKRNDIVVYILSAVMDEKAAEEKEEWVAKNLPTEMFIGKLFPRCGENKAEYVMNLYGELTKSDVLIDDYSTNLKEWEEAGGKGIKLINELNGRGTNGTNFRGDRIEHSNDPAKIYKDICRILKLPSDAFDQTLTIMVGLPGSGKSTIAKAVHEIEPEIEIISSDEVRKELFGNAVVQEDPASVFDVVNRRIHDSLKAGKNVLYDATNLYKRSRRSVLESIPEDKDVIVRFWVVDTPLEECIRRNAERDRRVPEEKIRAMAERFTRPTKSEWEGCIITKT